MKGYVDGDKTI